jgi:hypothetical protein
VGGFSYRQKGPTVLAWQPDGGPGRGGDQVLKRIVTIWVVAFIVFFVVSEPTSAANFVHAWYSHVDDVGHSLARFVKSL